MAFAEDMEQVSLAMNKASIQEVEEEVDVKKKIDRHCGFCLILVPGAEVKFCSKCKRRAYCSKACQTADWKTPKDEPTFNGKIYGYGQGHKNWCGLPYGEEDLDWKVSTISGKGLGLVALRDFPPLSRIIVDGMQAEPVDDSDKDYHPGMDDLTPLSTTNVSIKYHYNAITTSGFGSCVGLRISRANHSCDSNADFKDDADFYVLILYSNREIKKGEEICIAYISFNEIGMKDKGRFQFDNDNGKMSPESCRNLLSKKWGITCPPSCPCRDKEKNQMLKICNELYDECEKEFVDKSVLHKMERIIEIAGKLGCCASTMNRLYYLACGFAASRRTNLEKAKMSFEMCSKHNQAIYHPKNKSQLLDLDNELKDLIAMF